MKKTLLIAAAALAASVISSQAQVYSQNIVGYVNTSINGGNQLSLINNPLNGTTNGAEQILTALTGGETVFLWNGASFYQYVYAGPNTGTAIGYASDFYDGNGGGPGSIPGDSAYDTANGVYWTLPPQLPPGESFFVQNPNTKLTNTFVGTVVLSNTNAPVTLAGGNVITYVTSVPPIAGNLEGTNFNLPFTGGETVYVWNGSSYYQYVYAGPNTGTSIGYASDYYDGNGGGPGSIPGDSAYDTANGVYWTQPLNLNVGQGIAIQNPNSTETWSQNLIVQ
jgi:hypothetical protein